MDAMWIVGIFVETMPYSLLVVLLIVAWLFGC